MKRLSIFKNVVCNGIILVVVLSVFMIARAGAVSVSSKPKAIYKGSNTENVSLMVNVYWGTEYVQPMLDILSEYGFKTTFFIGGTWAAQNEQVLKDIYNAGHEIGNHGYYHKEHDKISESRNREEIEITHKLVKSILGIDMNLFAPPSGAFNETTLQVASSLGYQTIMWSADTIDWRDKDKTLIYNRAVKNLTAGNLILMHPTKATVEALPNILNTIKEKGLKVATVTNTLL